LNFEILSLLQGEVIRSKFTPQPKYVTEYFIDSLRS